MIHREADASETVCTNSLIDPQRKQRLTLTCRPGTRRNFLDMLRVIDRLKPTPRAKMAPPVNRQPGRRAIIVPSRSDEDLKARFPEVWEEERPDLRWVKAA
jgi:alkyl hydroperoxide reductase subunit AhpC